MQKMQSLEKKILSEKFLRPVIFKNDTACHLFVSHKEKEAFHYLTSLTLQSV